MRQVQRKIRSRSFYSFKLMIIECNKLIAEAKEHVLDNKDVEGIQERMSEFILSVSNTRASIIDSARKMHQNIDWYHIAGIKRFVFSRDDKFDEIIGRDPK